MTDELPLVAEGVSVNFGGLRALRDVALEVRPHEIVGLIGGNGAGKTTFMDCVSGYVRPAEGGRLESFGEELGPLPAEMRPYAGIVRSFQNARLYPGLTVTETLLVAVERRRPSGLFSSMLGLVGSRRAEAQKREWVDEIVESMGLVRYRENKIGELSTGTRRVADLATVIAQEPRLVLLDEPTAGLAQRETEAFGPLLHWVRERLGCAVLMIEHDMPLITSVADRLYALETGEVIAEGPPDDVVSDPRVVASYLGVDEVAIRRSGTAAGGPADAGAPSDTNGAARAGLDPRRLRSLKRDELLRMARCLGIAVTTRARKADLVAAVADAEPDRDSLTALTRGELLRLARQLGSRPSTRTRKAELVEMVAGDLDGRGEA